MLFLPLLATSLPGALAVPAAGLVAARQGGATQVVQLSSIENVAVRPNGEILATNMNSATLYAVDPVARTSRTAVTVAGAAGLSGIAEIAPDVFAVIGGKGIYKVDFAASPAGQPAASLMGTIAEASNLNGMCAFDNSSVLVADAGRGNVYRFDVGSGAYAVVLEDPTMAPVGGIPFGIDGIKYRDGEVWYTNIFANSLHRLPVDPATAEAAGPVTTLWTNLMGDDLCFGPNGKVYVTTNMGGNSLVEVDPDVGSPVPVATVMGSTSCAFGRTEQDANVAYVGAGQGVYAVTVDV